MGTRIAVALCLFAVVGVPALPSAAGLAAPSIQTSEPQQQYYVSGVVAKPGVYKFDPDAELTVTLAIEAAGGLTNDLKAADVSMSIYRKDANGRVNVTVAKLSDEIMRDDTLIIRRK